MAFHSGARGINAQINMTPMIDVLLVLLILFMVIAPTHPNGLPTALPQTSVASEPEEPSVVLQIDADGSLRMNSHSIDLNALSPELQRIFQNRADRTLFVSGNRDLPFAAVAAVLDVARGAGVDRIALLTEAMQSSAKAR